MKHVIFLCRAEKKIYFCTAFLLKKKLSPFYANAIA